MHKKWMKRLAYTVVLSTVVTVLIMEVALSLKESACNGVVSSVPEFTIYQGPCASDGNAFAFLALSIFLVSNVLALCNLWVVKRLKL